MNRQLPIVKPILINSKSNAEIELIKKLSGIEELSENFVATLKNGTSVFLNPSQSEITQLIKQTGNEGEFRFTAIPIPSGGGNFYIWPYWTIHENAISQLKALGKFPNIDYDDFTKSLTGVCEWTEGGFELIRNDVLEMLEDAIQHPEYINDPKFKRQLNYFLENINFIQNQFDWLSNWFINYDEANPFENLKMRMAMGFD